MKFGLVIFIFSLFFVIVPKNVFGMQVFIQPAEGASKMSLEVEPSDSIENVKAKIQDRNGVPPEDMRLVYNGTRLEEGRTLSDYNIPSGRTIDFVELEGGVANFTFNTNFVGGSCTWALYFASCTMAEAQAIGEIYFDNPIFNANRVGGQGMRNRINNLISIGNYELANQLKKEWYFLFEDENKKSALGTQVELIETLNKLIELLKQRKALESSL